MTPRYQDTGSPELPLSDSCCKTELLPVAFGSVHTSQASPDVVKEPLMALLSVTFVCPRGDLVTRPDCPLRQVAGGQGTIALELLSQLPAGKLDAVFVPVGGGGLISGISSV